MTRTPRILVVDDEADHAEAMAETLERVGYTVRTETSGESALQALENEDFDIVLTDLVMGEVSGIDILREARKVVPDVAVIVISGRGGVEAAEPGASVICRGFSTQRYSPLNSVKPGTSTSSTRKAVA